MDEIFIHILTGVFLIVVGLLVKRFPMLIAGYNTMPAEKKKNVDIAGLSSFMRRHLVIIGAFLDYSFLKYRFRGFILITQILGG